MDKSEFEPLNPPEIDFDNIDHEYDPMPEIFLSDFLDELPKWIDPDPADFVNDPNRQGPDYCDSCGTHNVVLERPMETGGCLKSRLDTDTDRVEGHPSYDSCPPGKYNIESCTCCGCPECGSQSIYRRSTVDPPYRCRHPDCGHEFERPAELPLNPDGRRDALYWECSVCGGPTLAPFEGIPDSWFERTYLI